MRLGVVVNPVAGMGGRVGLKGTDGNVAEARRRGAEPRAPERAAAALQSLHRHAPDTTVLTWGDPMGEREARAAGFDPEVLGTPDGETAAADTRAAVSAFLDRGVSLILFVGGDGTAVDVADAIGDADVPMLGVPAGVKIYSAVFAVSPSAAGRIAGSFDRTEDREVSDIDEDAYRAGEVRSTARAVVSVPVADAVQERKQSVGGSIQGLARGLADEADPEVTYLLGPGGTLAAIKSAFGFEGAPLGGDVYRDGAVVVKDGSERELRDALGERNVVVVSPIGGQGFVFGRGNDQLSPAIIRESEVRIVASREKLAETAVLRVDTGDPDLDESLRGWHRVRVGRVEHRLVRVV